GEGTPEDDCRGDAGHIRRPALRARHGILGWGAEETGRKERDVVARRAEIRTTVEKRERCPTVAEKAEPVSGEKEGRVTNRKRRDVPFVDDERQLRSLQCRQLDIERRRGNEIGRASCRERGEVLGVGGFMERKARESGWRQ